MKKLLILQLICLGFHSIGISQTGAISDITISQRPDGSGLADIYFNLNGTSPTYYITAEASFDNGITFAPIPPSSLSGDTGPIIEGTGKHVIWNGHQSFLNTFSTQAKVKLNISTSVPDGFPCPGMATVFYGGQTYNTVQLGSQCWMVQNLNIGIKINGTVNQTNNSIIEKYCYNDLESNCNIYGGLYQWNEIMHYVTTAGVQGICPTNWHIPTDDEWTTITNSLGGVSVAGGKMKSPGTIQTGNGLWNTPNTLATNESGFSAVPAGCRTDNGSFITISDYGDWWSSTEDISSDSWVRYMGYNYGYVGRNDGNKNYGFSVRCLRDY